MIPTSSASPIPIDSVDLERRRCATAKEMSRLVRGRSYRIRRAAEICRRLNREYPLEMTEEEVGKAERQAIKERAELVSLCRDAEYEEELIQEHRSLALQSKEAQEEARREAIISRHVLKTSKVNLNRSRQQTESELRAAQNSVSWKRNVDEAFAEKQRASDAKLAALLNRKFFLKTHTPPPPLPEDVSLSLTRPLTSLGMTSTQERLERGRDVFTQHWEEVAQQTEASVAERRMRQQQRVVAMREGLAQTAAVLPVKTYSHEGCAKTVSQRGAEFFGRLGAVNEKYRSRDKRMTQLRNHSGEQRRVKSDYHDARRDRAEHKRNEIWGEDPRTERDQGRHLRSKARLNAICKGKTSNVVSLRVQERHDGAKARREIQDMERKEAQRLSHLSRLGFKQAPAISAE